MLLKMHVKNKNKNILPLIGILSLMVGIVLNLNLVKVDADSNNPTSADFVAQAYFENGASAGANQSGHPDSLWFDNVKPGSEVRATILITNKSKSERTFQVSAYTASTNVSGGLSYDTKKPKMDDSQKIKFDSLFKNNDVTVKVPGSETNQGQVAVSLSALIPNIDYKGTVLGGFRVYAFDPTEKQKRKQTALVNKFAYVIPVVLNINSDNYDVSNPKEAFKLGTVVPQVRFMGKDAEPGVLVNIHNTKAALISNFRTNVEITPKGSSNSVATIDSEGNQMAPNSVWSYPIKWGSNSLKSGTYHLTMKVRYEGRNPAPNKTPVSKKYDFKMEKDFTITSAQANQLNRQMGIKPNYLWLWITLGVLAILLLVLLVWYLARGSKKNNSV